MAKEVRSPIAVRPVALSTLDEVDSTATITDLGDGTTPGDDDINMRLFSVTDCASFGELTQIGGSRGPTTVVDFFASAVPDTAVDYKL